MIELMLVSGSRQVIRVKFLGERQASEVITGSALAELVGLTPGTVINDDSGWLHFDVEGQELYIAKKPLRHTVSWEQLDSKGAVYGRDIYQYQDKVFKVRLLTGGDSDPASGPGGEWDNVLRRILAGRGMADYTDADLGIGTNIVGRSTLVQETRDGSPGVCLIRGGSTSTIWSTVTKSTASNVYSWRPVLEVLDPNAVIWPVTNIIYETDYVKSIRPFYWGYTD